jgi:hypothetical protein
MFGYAMRTRPLKNLGMKLAAETPIGAFPLLDYLIVTCETVAHGVNQLSRYFRLNDAPYALEIREQENTVRIIFHGTRDSLSFEFGVSLVVLHLREETENRFRPSAQASLIARMMLLRCSKFSAARSGAARPGTAWLSRPRLGTFLCDGAMRFYAECSNGTRRKSSPAYRQAMM